MGNDRSTEYCEVVHSEMLHVRDRQQRRPVLERREEPVGPWSYRAKIGRGMIRLSPIEYRILMFLAAQPYRAFSRRRIAAAVSTGSHPVTAEKLGPLHSLLAATAWLLRRLHPIGSVYRLPVQGLSDWNQVNQCRQMTY